MSEKSDWRFGVVGNIVGEHLGEDGKVYYGTKAFTSGTKVYINGKQWFPSTKEIGVIGRNRFGRFVVESVPLKMIENVRCQRIYQPAVLDHIYSEENLEGWQWWGRTVADRKETEAFVKDWDKHKEE